MKTKHGRRKKPSKEPQSNANAAPQSPPADENDDGIELRVTRLNLRFVSVLLAGVVVLGVSLLLVHAYQTRKNAAVFKERAHAALKDGDFARAITLLDRYVGMRPNDVDALIQLGDLRSDRAVTGQQFQNAFSVYERVLAQEPDRHDVRRRHVDVAMHLGRYSDAITHLAVLVDAARKRGPRPEERTDKEENGSSGGGSLPDLLILAGDCHYTLAKMPEAIGLYLQGLALAPEAINGYRGLAYALQQTSEPPPRDGLLGPVPREFRLDFKTAPQAARHWSELQALFPSSEESTGAKAALVESVLTRMADLGRPLPRALLTRARFRTQILSQDDRFSIEAQRENRRAQLDAARKDLDAALELSPDDRDLLLASAELALTQAETRRSEGDSDDAFLEKARRDAERGIKQSPPDLRFFQLLSDIELATDNEPRERFQRAEEHLKSALELVPEIVKGASPREQRVIVNLDGEIRWQLADVLITSAQLAPPPDEKLLERAREIVDALQQNNARSPLIEFLASRLTMVERRDQPETWNRVAQKLHSIRHDLRSRRDLLRRIGLMLGECYQRLANPDARISLYRQALAEDPLWIQGRRELASVLAEQNRIDDALREYSLISGAPGVALQMARLMILRNLTRPETAERPRQWEPILRLLDGGEKLAPDDVQLAVVRAQVLSLQKEYVRAQQILETALESHSDEPDVWAALVGLELRREDREPEERLRTAEELLARAGKQLGDRVELRLAAADLAIARGSDTTLALVELEADSEKLPRNERLLLLEGLARAHARIDSKDARRIWLQLATENPHDLRYQVTAVTAAQADEDVDELRRLLARIREVEGAGGANGNVIEASLLIQEANESRASGRTLRSLLARPRDLLQRAAEERPSWAAVPELLGHLETALGNDDLAIEHYERAISLGSHSTRVIERLVALLYERQRYQDADRLLAGMARERPELISGNLARWQAEIAWQQEHFDRALRVARDRARASTDPQDAIWRARFLIAWYYKLLADGRSEEAEPLVDEADRLYRDAIELNRDSPTIWLAYIRHLARLNEIQRAEAVIRESQEHLPNAPEYLAPLTLARCYEAIGNRQRAEEHFRRAADAAAGESVVQMAFADFYMRGGDFGAAEREVRKIIDQPDPPEHAVAAARRQLAYLTGIRPGATWADARRALDIVAKLQKKDEPETSTDLRIRISILARQNVQSARLQLVDALEELARRDDLRPQEQSQLLAAYLSLNRWPDARRMLERRIADEPANAQHYVDLITGLLQREDINEEDILAAEGALLRLDAVEPHSLRTRIAKARLLVAQDQPSRAAEMMVHYIRNLQPPSTDEVLQALQTGQDSEKLIDSVSEHLLLQPDASARRVLMEARSLKNEGKFEDAVGVLRDYLQAKADFSEIVAAETIRYVARLLEEFQQPEAAEEAWRLYAARSPLPQAKLTLAYFLARERKYDEALDLCEQSWGTVSDDVAAEHHLGVLSSALRRGVNVAERIPAVEERLRTILQDDAASPRVLSVAAAFRDLQGRFDEAERMYWLVLRQNDRNVVALNNLAFLLALRGQRLNEAEQLINRAIDLAGPAPELLDTRAVVRGARKKPSQAIADLKQAIKQAPTATKYFHLAQIHWEAGDHVAARDALGNARKLGLKRSDLHPLQHASLEQMDARI